MIDVALSELSKWLAATPLSHTIQTTSWIIPTIQIIHILGVAVLFSSAVLVDLRIWRLLERDIPLTQVARLAKCRSGRRGIRAIRSDEGPLRVKLPHGAKTASCLFLHR